MQVWLRSRRWQFLRHHEVCIGAGLQRRRIWHFARQWAVEQVRFNTRGHSSPKFDGSTVGRLDLHGQLDVPPGLLAIALTIGLLGQMAVFLAQVVTRELGHMVSLGGVAAMKFAGGPIAFHGQFILANNARSQQYDNFGPLGFIGRGPEQFAQQRQIAHQRHLLGIGLEVVAHQAADDDGRAIADHHVAGDLGDLLVGQRQALLDSHVASG